MRFIHSVGGMVMVISCSVVSNSLWPHDLYPARHLCPWEFSGKNTGAGSHFLLQGIFPTRDQIQVSHIAGRLYHLSHQEIIIATWVLSVWSRFLFNFLVLAWGNGCHTYSSVFILQITQSLPSKKQSLQAALEINWLPKLIRWALLV